MGIDAQMLVNTSHKLTPREVLRISFEVGGAFGADKFMMFRKDGEHALSIVDEYTQDGATIHPKAGEQFIAVRLWTRYYGPGYERGDLPFLVHLAEWLEARIPGASVWYGGDSSGVCAEPFDKAARAKMFAHFVEHGHRPYFGAGLGDKDMSRHCAFCDEPMVRRGWGQNYAVFCCSGCGTDETSRDKGKTWLDSKEDRKQEAAAYAARAVSP